MNGCEVVRNQLLDPLRDQSGSQVLDVRNVDDQRFVHLVVFSFDVPRKLCDKKWLLDSLLEYTLITRENCCIFLFNCDIGFFGMVWALFINFKLVHGQPGIGRDQNFVQGISQMTLSSHVVLLPHSCRRRFFAEHFEHGGRVINFQEICLFL